jgi:hypothetical protein
MKIVGGFPRTGTHELPENVNKPLMVSTSSMQPAGLNNRRTPDDAISATGMEA